MEDLRLKRIQNVKDRRYEPAKLEKNPEKKYYLTVADADFAYSKAIQDDVIKEIKTGDLTYQFVEEDNFKDVSVWYKKHWGVTVDSSNSMIAHGVLYWIHVAINAVTKPGDGVLIQNPVYDPFMNVIKFMGRKVVDSPLKFVKKENKYVIDFVDLDKKMAKAKAFILCSPHNPTGNVWTKEEIEKIQKLAKKHKVTLIVDEIWQDVVFSEKKLFHSLQLKDQSNIIHIGSPTKTFNLGGLHYGIATMKNKALFNKMVKFEQAQSSCSSNQPWIMAAVKSCYTNKKNITWKNEYLTLLQENRDKLAKLFDKHNIEYSMPEGTYLFWVKLGNKNLKGDDLDKMLQKHNMFLTIGDHYGQKYAEWTRIDFAVSQTSMTEILKHLEAFIKKTR